MWHSKVALSKMKAEMKGQERVRSSLVKHILVLLPEGSAGRTVTWAFRETRMGKKKEGKLPKF